MLKIILPNYKEERALKSLLEKHEIYKQVPSSTSYRTLPQEAYERLSEVLEPCLSNYIIVKKQNTGNYFIHETLDCNILKRLSEIKKENRQLLIFNILILFFTILGVYMMNWLLIVISILTAVGLSIMISYKSNNKKATKIDINNTNSSKNNNINVNVKQ